MRTVAVTCPSCGAQLDVDLKTKSAICEFCNRRVVLTEDDIAAGELVENNVALAKEAFLDGDIKNAESHARTILGYDSNNIVAGFLLAYIREYVFKVRGESPVKTFFSNVDLSNASDTEIYTVLQFISIQPVYYIPYIETIESFTCLIQDKSMANAFMDRFLYTAVSVSKSSTWFPGGIERMRIFYTQKMTKYTLAKAYIGLYDSLRKLEDSPLVSGYNLITRARLFFNEYVMAVCEAIGCMPVSAAKTKLVAACENIKNKIKAGIDAREAEINAIDSMVYSYEKDDFISVSVAAASEHENNCLTDKK